VGGREIELDEIEQEMLEQVFDEDLIDSLCKEFDHEAVKSLVVKLGLEFPEDIFPKEEDS